MPIVQVHPLRLRHPHRRLGDVRLAVVDPSPDASTIELRNRFTATDAFRVVASPAECR